MRIEFHSNIHWNRAETLSTGKPLDLRDSNEHQREWSRYEYCQEGCRCGACYASQVVAS